MLKAIIFDFDGVLVDSEKLHHQAFNEIFRPLGVQISIREYFDRFVGMTDEELFRLIDKEKNLHLSEEQLQKLFRDKAVSFKQLAIAQAAVIDGVPQFLKLLADNKIPMAVCSGALLEEIEMILKGTGLRDYFEAIVSAEQVSRGKPDPEGFLLALKLLNKKSQTLIKPSDCIVIEDSRWGLEAAKAAGMRAVAITNSYAADQLKPSDKTIAKLGELSIDNMQALCS
jgi:beta-phosphoglucomutase